MIKKRKYIFEETKVENLKSIEDSFSTDIKVNEDIKESDDKKTVLATVEGVFLEMDIVNQNNRLYNKNLVENKILNTEYTKNHLENKTLLGEAKHPSDRTDVIYDEVSHSITDLWIDDNKLMGRADILDTESGRRIKTLLDYGCTLSVSARATGNLTKKGNYYIPEEESYNFKTFDLVLNPGFPSAKVHQIDETFKNVQEEIYNNLETINKDSAKKILEALNTPKAQECLEKLNSSESSEETNIEITRKTDFISDTFTLIEEVDLEKKNTNLKKILESKRKEIIKLNEKLNDTQERLKISTKKSRVVRESLNESKKNRVSTKPKNFSISKEPIKSTIVEEVSLNNRLSRILEKQMEVK